MGREGSRAVRHRNSPETPLLQYCDLVTDCSVQCGIGSIKKPETTVVLLELVDVPCRGVSMYVPTSNDNIVLH